MLLGSMFAKSVIPICCQLFRAIAGSDEGHPGQQKNRQLLRPWHCGVQDIAKKDLHQNDVDTMTAMMINIAALEILSTYSLV
jgi:hypothetical protein